MEWLSGVNNEINCDEHRIQWRVPDDYIGYSCTNTNKGSENHVDDPLEGQAGKREISHMNIRVTTRHCERGKTK